MRTVEEIENYIMESPHKVVAIEPVRDVLRARMRREKELEEELHQLRSSALRSQNRGLRGGEGNVPCSDLLEVR